MAKQQSDLKNVFLFLEWAGLIGAAVLFFVSINGYSLREYYFSSDVEKLLGDYLLPGIGTRKILFWIAAVVSVVSAVLKHIVGREKDE